MKHLLLLLPLLLFAKSPFETLDMRDMDLSAYETKKGEQNLQASKNVKVTCRLVCDKKVYKEQKISDAIEFYKKTKKKNPSTN
ncbi:MAG TPA: hypothetical protein VLZ29_07420 [Sulfurimonas sp.]|jgi:hypothetical protein|uniref:hypothetical protein n=1 Tax=Sulfurimonas sp. TaxID=2022749 RepID=UPI002B81AC29|nr:hypothetical protein [Sulfurimonas sp.]HUH42928.1 hypothetical protein [Sulfurimonas sp.]